MKGATTHFEPLISSSNQASLADRDAVMMAINDPASLRQAAATGKRYTLAARITGQAVFPGVGQGNVNIIVVADTDIFDDRFWLRSDGPAPEPFADNEGLVLSAVENLTGSDDLISLRMRGNTDRPFTVVRAMQADAEQKFRDTVTNLQGQLTASEQEIAQLQQGGSGSDIALTPAQTAEIERVRREIAGTRAVLRDVQRRLRADIDRLGTILAFINILLMPLLVTGFRHRVRHPAAQPRPAAARRAEHCRSGDMMDKRRRILIGLGSAALVSVLLAGFALEQRAAEGQPHYTPTELLPGFSANVKNAALIHIASHAATFDVAGRSRQGLGAAGQRQLSRRFR